MSRDRNIRYPRFRPAWGKHPLGAIFGALFSSALFGGAAWLALQAAFHPPETLVELGAQGELWTRRGGYAIAGLMFVLIAWQVLTLILAVPDAVSRKKVEGEVVAREAFRYGRGKVEVIGRLWHLYQRRRDRNRHTQERPLRHYLAVDTGDGDRPVAWRVRPAIHAKARMGARVRAVVAPRLGYVRSIEVLSQAPGGTDDPASALAGRVGKAAARRVLQGMEGRFEELEGMRDEHGRPILEQTDEEGVTLRERVEEARRLSGEHLQDPDQPEG